MDNRKAKRSRSATIIEDGHWDCSFCTYRNKSESFKCEMCNIRKGTSTRKPRITQVTQQFVKIENQIEQERKKEKRKEILLKTRAHKKNSLTSSQHNKFANAQTISITVNDVTVFITDIELNNLENENELLNKNNNSLEIKHNSHQSSSKIKNELDESNSSSNQNGNNHNNNNTTNHNTSELNNTDENTSSNIDDNDIVNTKNANLNENENTNDTSMTANTNTTTNNNNLNDNKPDQINSKELEATN